MLKWTTFMLKVEKSNKVLLYNTFNSAIILLDKEEFQGVKSYLKLDSGQGENPVIDELKRANFLIDSNVDEVEFFTSELNKELQLNNHFTLHFLPTTGCNFNCPYCYQSGINRGNSLDEEKSKQIVEYVAEYVAGRGLKNATVVIHGGEPTVMWKPVEIILPLLKDIFLENGIDFRTQIVSNGYNLTGEKADFLHKYNWQRFQVTIDGPKDVHNARRKLHSGGETFDKIIENIRYVLDEKKIEKVSIRINFDKDNIEDIPELLEYLSKTFDTKRIILSLGFISKTVDDTEANNYIIENGLLLDEIKDKYMFLYKSAVDNGFDVQDLFMFDGMCTAKLDNAMVISSDGNIYKCLSGVGRDDFVVGNIASKPMSLPNYLFPELYNECLEKGCEFLPICNTGCRFNAYLKNGDIKSIDCRREVLEEINTEILAYKYLRED